MRFFSLAVLACQVVASISGANAGAITTSTDSQSVWSPSQPAHTVAAINTVSDLAHSQQHQLDRRMLNLPSPKQVYNNVIDKLSDKVGSAFYFVIYTQLEVDLNTLRDLLVSTTRSVIDGSIIPKLPGLLKELMVKIRDAVVNGITNLRNWFSVEYQVFVANFIAEKTRFFLRKQLYWKGTAPTPPATNSTNCSNANSSDGAVECKPVSIPAPTSTVPAELPAKPTGVLGMVRKISDAVAVGTIMRTMTKPLRLAVDEALRALIGTCKVVAAPAQLGLNSIEAIAKKIGDAARKIKTFSTDALFSWLKRVQGTTQSITQGMLNDIKQATTAASSRQASSAPVATGLAFIPLSESLEAVPAVSDVTIETNFVHLATLSSKCDQINGLFKAMWEALEKPVKTTLDKNIEEFSTKLQGRAVDQLKERVQLAINDIVPIYPEIVGIINST
ncbi:hypothetical protein BDF19DRAFT_428785 [Syncephalis fuscata]|nr:hypothetical protein BDF19DRAFT_428785 [Syncephalis fuscata]